MYNIAPERQGNYLGDILIYPIVKKYENGTLTTKFDVQETRDEDNYVEGFKCYLAQNGKSPKTLESYVGDITGFIQYLDKIGVAFNGEMKRFHITSYRNYLVENSYEPATINKKVNSLQAFNRYLIEQEVMKDIVVVLRKDRVKIAE